MGVGSLAVVMPVHNALPYLDESIASVLAQTHRDFKLVVLENGSTDGSAERLAQWGRKDARIELHHHPERLGGARSSHMVVELADAPIVARMDADDVSHPQRLERQLAVLREHPEVAMVATLQSCMDAAGHPVLGRDRWPLAPGRGAMPFPNGSVMFRREVYDEVGGYRQVRGGWEDLDFCIRMSRSGRMLVIPEALYRFRFHLASRTASAPPQLVAEGAEAQGQDPAAALFQLNSLQMWAGSRPKHLDDLRRAARRRSPARRLALAAWARWAAISPTSLRAVLRWRTAVRDLLAAPWHLNAKPYEWHPG